MKKLIHWIKNNYLFLLPLLLIFIFIISIWDKNTYIGGDLILPLNPQNNIYKSIYLWDQSNRGFSFFEYMRLSWQIPFYIFSLLGIPPFVGIKIFITIILVIGFTFTYLLFRALFRNTEYNRKDLAVFCAFVFILSASPLNILAGSIFLSALPLCSYLLVKYLDTKKFWYIILFSIAVNQGYLSDFPQAKYLFILLGTLVFILLLYKQLRQESLRNLILKLLPFSLGTVFLNAFVLVPFLFDSFKSNGVYSYYSKNVTVYSGDADLHSAALPYITRFFNSNLVNDVSTLGRFLNSRLFSIWTFTLWIVAFLPLFIVKTKKEKKIVYVLFAGLLFFIFIAKGSNPPFGEVYKFVLFHLPVFKIFRTTSTLMIGGTLFFAILVTISLFHLSKKWRMLFYLVLFIHIIVFHSIYSGYKLISLEENGKIQRGYPIPQEYYDMGKRLDTISEDVKILSLPLDETYSYKDWGYMGTSIMDWITKKPFIHAQIAGYSGFKDNLILQRMSPKEACLWIGVNNIGYILNEKDSRIPYAITNFNFSGTTIFENTYFKLDKMKNSCVLPHIYAAENVFLFQGENNSIPDMSRFTKDKRDIVIGMDSNWNKIENLDPVSNIVIEAYPNEVGYVSEKTSKDISSLPQLSFLTYSFIVPKSGEYQLMIDAKERMNKDIYKLVKGTKKIKIPIQKSKNLIDYDFLTNNTHNTTFSQVLHGWERDSVYLISFTYTGDIRNRLGINLEEMQRTYNGRLAPYDLNSGILSQEILNDQPGIHTYQALVRSDINALSAKVTITNIVGQSVIKSLNIQKILLPKVFFVHLKEERKNVPSIISHRVNPTKYIVDVTNSKSPYYLVLSETFNSNWKAYIKQCNTSCTIFDEWFYKPIPEEQHIIVNGFANGWYILPSDGKGKENYRIIIEYWPQRLFYIGCVISLIIVLIWSFVRLVTYTRGKYKKL